MVVHVKDRACLCCGRTLHAISELRTEQVAMAPLQLWVLVTRRPRCAYHHCQAAMVVALTPDRPVDDGMPTEALAHHVVVRKLADFPPTYRRVQMLERKS